MTRSSIVICKIFGTNVRCKFMYIQMILTMASGNKICGKMFFAILFCVS